MHLLAVGAAFVDRTGAVVAADPGFFARLGLRPEDPAGTLLARAESSPELGALLRGDGPGVASITGADGDALQVERFGTAGGALLVLRAARAPLWLEEAMRSSAFGRLASGVAHDIKNPLNAMSLQLALIWEKLSGSAEASAAASTHLAVLRDQIGRVNEVLRRFLDVADPGAPFGYTDLGALVADLGALFAHEGRRRRIALSVDAQPGTARTPCDPTRVGRLVLGLFARALGETPDGGKVDVRAEVRDSAVVFAIEHVAGDPDGEVGYYREVAAAAAAALGGEFVHERRVGVARFSLALPRNERA